MTHKPTNTREALLQQIFQSSDNEMNTQYYDKDFTKAVMSKIHLEISLRNFLSILSITVVAVFIILQLLPLLDSLNTAVFSISNVEDPWSLITSSALFYPAIILLLGLFTPYLFERSE